jgi:PAS domain S-box-containing protein
MMGPRSYLSVVWPFKGRAISQRSSQNTLLLGIVSLILIVLVSLSYRQWSEYRSANAEAELNREILISIGAIQSTLVDAETGQRGYLLTGENSYLEPYNQSLQGLPADLAKLSSLLSQSQERSQSKQRQDFEELDYLANRKLQELRHTIEVRRTQGAQAALAIVLTQEGKHTMDSIRALCAQMQRNESNSQVRASAEGEAAAGIALLIMAAGSLVLLFFFAFWLQPFANPDPQAWQRPWLLRYGAAILGVVAITLIRAALTPLGGPIAMPFTLYFCSVAFAAWFGGFRPALVSIVLSLLAGSWFFAAPTHSLLVRGHDDQVAMVMIVLVGFGIALLSRSQWNAVEHAMHAEASERAGRQRFETTLASIGDAVIATDAQGRITFLNKVAEALLRWPEPEARGRPLDEVLRIVNETTRAVVESPVARVLREGKIVGLANHTVLIARDGTEVPIDDSAAPIRDGDGNLQGTVLVFRDVTERRHTENRLAEQAILLERAAAEARSQRQRLGLALTAGKMGVYEVDPIRKTLWWSPETCSLFGVDPAEFKPTRNSFAAMIHSADREIFMQYWDENIAAFQPINREFRILKPGGKERWISCRGTPGYDNAGSPARYSGLFLDVTERREAEQVLRRFEKMSAAARLSAAIAHEINNPLGAVSNLIFLAKEAPGVPQSVVELLVRAEQELERVAHAARQALGFYRESSRADAVDLPELIDSVLKIYSTKIAEKKIKVVRGFLNCTPVYGVYGEIRQAVSNLLANAIEAVREGGIISLGTRPVETGGEQGVEIVIADDGCGVATEHLDHIFEPFFTTKAGTGTGLGLWVAKEIIERHQGSIEVQSPTSDSDRRGTTFTVRLPVWSGTRASKPLLDPRKSVERVEARLSESQSTG